MKIFKGLVGCLASIVVLVGCQSAAAVQSTFIQRFEQVATANDQSARNIELGVTDVEMRNAGAAGTDILSLTGTVTQHVSEQTLAFKGAFHSASGTAMPEIDLVVKGDEAYVKVGSLLRAPGFRDEASDKLAPFANQFLKTADFAALTDRALTSEQLALLLGQTDTGLLSQVTKNLVETLKSLPADRFTQNGDKITAKLGRAEVTAVLTKTNQMQQQLLDGMIEDMTLEITVDTKTAAQTFKLTLVTAGDAPLKRATVTLNTSEATYADIVIPSGDALVTAEQLLEAVKPEPRPKPDDKREVSDEEFQVALASLQTFMTTGDGSQMTPEEREAYYINNIENNPDVIFTDEQKALLREAIIGE